MDKVFYLSWTNDISPHPHHIPKTTPEQGIEQKLKSVHLKRRLAKGFLSKTMYNKGQNRSPSHHGEENNSINIKLKKFDRNLNVD